MALALYLARHLNNLNAFFRKHWVADLERIATAFFIANVSDMPTTTQEMATKINKIKPHISTEEALKALETESKLTAEAKELLIV